jgi:hypothetical protein
VELWEQELSVYRDRLTQVQKWRPDLSRLVERLPEIPLNYLPSTEGAVALQISLFVVSGCVAHAGGAAAAFSILWRNGLLATISLPARLVLELWGAAHFARQTLEQMERSGDAHRALQTSQRLLVGVRSDVQLPWGGFSEQKSIHVMEFVRSLADVYPEAEGTYDFLCESCHPSFLRLTSWSLAGPALQNWENETFRQSAHGLVDRTLRAVERALEGIGVDAAHTLETGLTYIDADRSDNIGSSVVRPS